MDWEREHRKRVEANARKVAAIYEKAVQEAALIGATITNFNPDRPFSFDDYTGTQHRIDKLMTSMAHEIRATVVNGSSAEWEHSNFKNNELAMSVLGYNRPTAPGQQLNLFAPPPEAATNPSLAKYFQDNTKARDAFIARKTEGMNLSARVWKYTNQFKTELEMSLDDGIRNGKPATAIARDLRQFLVEPDRVYRRFQMNLKDANGNDVLDRSGNKITFKQLRRRYINPDTGAETWRVETDIYKPGQGVYKSSLRNSQRVSRTENNMAYRTADHTRMQQMDFIVGQEITLSNAHLVYDMCNQLQGKYPKEFFYKGWHPHCYCPVKFILKTVEELKLETEQILNQEPTSSQSVNQVTEMPDGFKRWVKDNEERVLRASHAPYFIADNFIQGNITNGMTYEPIQAEIAAQNARDAATQQAMVQAAIQREAEFARIEAVRIAEMARVEEAIRIEAVRLAEIAEIAEQARINAERIAEEARVEAARVAEETRIAEEAARVANERRIATNARNVANRHARIARAEAVRVAEIARIAEEARVAALETERLEAERLAALTNSTLGATIARAQRKIAEARALNAIGPQLDALVISISIPNPNERNIKYRIDQMNIVIREIRLLRASAAAPAQSATAPVQPIAAVPPAAITRAARTATAAARASTTAAATGSATITAATTDAELLSILKAKLAANRTIGYQGNYMDWWTEFSNGGNVRSGFARRDELLRGIRRMEEFAESHRTGHYTSDALAHFRGTRTIPPPPPPPKPRKPGDPFKMDANERSKLKAAGWYGMDESDTPSNSFNQLMEGYDLIEFDHEFNALMKKYAVNINYKKMEMNGSRFTFTITGSHKGDDFRMTRTFKRKPNGDKTVSHDYLDIPDKLQGNNLTKELFSALYKQYNNANVVEMTVHANITVGSYAWGRYGFVADLDNGGSKQRYALIEMIEQRKRKGWTEAIPERPAIAAAPGITARAAVPAVPPRRINEADMDAMVQYIKSRPMNENIDMHKVTGMKGAKDVFMSKHWYGHIDLKNKDRRDIFEAYLAQRK